MEEVIRPGGLRIHCAISVWKGCCRDLLIATVTIPIMHQRRPRDCKSTSENSVNGASTGLLDRYRSDGDMEFLPHRRKASEVLRAE